MFPNQGERIFTLSSEPWDYQLLGSLSLFISYMYFFSRKVIYLLYLSHMYLLRFMLEYLSSYMYLLSSCSKFLGSCLVFITFFWFMYSLAYIRGTLLVFKIYHKFLNEQTLCVKLSACILSKS